MRYSERSTLSPFKRRTKAHKRKSGHSTYYKLLDMKKIHFKPKNNMKYFMVSREQKRGQEWFEN